MALFTLRATGLRCRGKRERFDDRKVEDGEWGGGRGRKEEMKVKVQTTFSSPILTRLTVSRFAWVPCGAHAHRFLRIRQAQMRALVLADGTVVYGV